MLGFPVLGGGLGATSLGNQNYMTKILVTFICFLFSISSFPLQIDPPSPYSYLSYNGRYLAEIFPANSKFGNDSSAVCYFYKVEHKTYHTKDRFELLWKINLVNDTSPLTALVTSEGYLITFDEFWLSGDKHSLTIYGKDGVLIKDYRLDELIPIEELNQFLFDSGRFELVIPNTIGKYDTTSEEYKNDIILVKDGRIKVHTNWRFNARYFLTNLDRQPPLPSWILPTHLYILLANNKALEIRLSNGENKYFELSEFPKLLELVTQIFVNDEVKLNSINIDFSSVTELLKCLE